MRRLAFALIIISMASMSILLPKNFAHFSNLMATVVLVVLVVSYVGLLVAPSLSIHQLTDVMEPEHAGSWRGVFKHKNEAGGVMVVFVCIGAFIAQARSRLLGWAIIVLSSVFLIFTFSKTSIALLPFIMLAPYGLMRMRSARVQIALVLGGLAIFNLFSIGSIYFPAIRAILSTVTSDPTFTGRTDIWEFAGHALMQRPITGFGFSAFFGTDLARYGLSEGANWATAATDAHNAYLNIALGTGFPGMALTILWVVVLPLLNLQHVRRDGEPGVLALLFLRIWLFGVFGSCFESIFFKSGGEPWFAVLISMVGLRMLASSRLMQGPSAARVS